MIDLRASDHGRLRTAAGCALVVLLLGCSQHQITGEPLVYGVEPLSGAVVDRDVLGALPENSGTVPHKGEIITIVVNSVFLRYLEDRGSPHVLVYAEVYDDGTDDPSTALTKVLFDQRDQPPGVNLGLADRTLYGPVAFKGYPIRIRFFVVELDKEEKEQASKIIGAAGAAAAAAQPQYAPAVALGVQIAEAINALNEDDFELRFDLTLYPIGPLGNADIADARLRASGEPVQRQTRPVVQAASLRTGSFAVLKREISERVPEELAPKVLSDWTQEAHVNSYTATDGSTVLAEEVLRVQGGHLYRIVRHLSQNGSPVSAATVRLREEPNDEVDFGLAVGVRQQFRDQTYVTLSVINGLPVGVSEVALRKASQRDVAALASLLDNPSGLSDSERMGEQVDSLAATVKSLLQQQRVADIAARRVGRDPSFRTSAEYPAFWARQIDPLAGLAKGSVAFRNSAARNAGLLDSLSDIVVNLPILDPEDAKQMAALQKLKKSDFEPVSGQQGLFNLTSAASSKL